VVKPQLFSLIHGPRRARNMCGGFACRPAGLRRRIHRIEPEWRIPDPLVQICLDQSRPPATSGM